MYIIVLENNWNTLMPNIYNNVLIYIYIHTIILSLIAYI